jgi:hypothetical protein
MTFSLQKVNYKSLALGLVSYLAISCYVAPWSVLAQSSQEQPTVTEHQARALKMLRQQAPNTKQIKNLRIQVEKLSDSQGQAYLGALVSRAELLPYLSQLKGILKQDFQGFRANQVARDHHSFHLTLLSPKEYQLADKTLIEKLLASGVNSNFSNQLYVSLLGLGKVEQDDKATFFVVAQSSNAQLIRQQFLLPAKDFHVTLGFSPNDIYGVKKDSSTLID